MLAALCQLHAPEKSHTIQAVDLQARWAVSQNSQVDNRVRRAISSRRFFRILLASCWSWPWLICWQSWLIAFVTSWRVPLQSLSWGPGPNGPGHNPDPKVGWDSNKCSQCMSMWVPETKITCQFLSIGSIGPLAWPSKVWLHKLAAIGTCVSTLALKTFLHHSPLPLCLAHLAPVPVWSSLRHQRQHGRTLLDVVLLLQ